MRRLLTRLVPISELSQRRLFPILAVIAGLALVARLIAGLVDPGKVGSQFDEIVFCSCLLAHGLGSQYLRWVQSLIRIAAEAAGLPEWVAAQAEKNLWKGVLYVGPGFVMAFFVLWSSLKKPVSGAWLDGLIASNLAFQVGAFAGEFLVVNAQGRLFRDVQGWAKKAEAELANSEL